MSDVPGADLDAQLAALRGQPRWQADPTRWEALEAMAHRLDRQSPAVRRILEGKLRAALQVDAAQGLSVEQIDPSAMPVADNRDSLAELNAHLRQLAAARSGPALPGDEAHPDELANARRFRRSWDQLRTLVNLDQAVARAPANAGPLNSHALVLRALARMRDLSPEYLRRFLGHVESLQWLEQAREQVRDAAKKPKVAAPRKRKPAPG